MACARAKIWYIYISNSRVVTEFYWVIHFGRFRLVGNSICISYMLLSGFQTLVMMISISDELLEYSSEVTIDNENKHRREILLRYHLLVTLAGSRCLPEVVVRLAEFVRRGSSNLGVSSRESAVVESGKLVRGVAPDLSGMNS